MQQSIVYFARQYTVTHFFGFKIGESGRGLRRQKDSNFPENFYIDSFFETPIDSKSCRLFIESWLRVYIEKHYNCTLVKKDTFEGRNYKEVLRLYHDFPRLYEKAVEAYNKI